MPVLELVRVAFGALRWSLAKAEDFVSLTPGIISVCAWAGKSPASALNSFNLKTDGSAHSLMNVLPYLASIT